MPTKAPRLRPPGLLGIEPPKSSIILATNPSAGLVARTEPRSIVTMEVFIEKDMSRQRGSLWNFSVPHTPVVFLFHPEEDGVSRLAISLLTSKRFIIFPEPVGTRS